ncbi:MAG: hypothetical protein GQ574_28295 [Crocinitomix sp.]|nr:hypothetical protein [Crocinitomix sp.]
MKKLLITSIVALALFSCGKNYYCDCSATDTSHNDSFLLENYKEDDAIAKCAEFDTSGVVDGWSCELK